MSDKSGWPSLNALIDSLYDLDDYQRRNGMMVVDVRLLDLDAEECNACIQKITRKGDGPWCYGILWAYRVHTRWFFMCGTRVNLDFFDRVIVPNVNRIQSLMHRECDMIDNGRRLESWM